MNINLGAGYTRNKDYISVDIDPRCQPDVLCDLNEGLPFEDNSVDNLVASHVLEHIKDLDKIMREIYRVLKVNGKATIHVPRVHCRAAISDPNHIRYFVPETFIMYSNPNAFMPQRYPYDTAGLFEIEELASITASSLSLRDSYGDWFIELKCVMRKVDKDYWKSIGIHKNIKNSENNLYGCFFCWHKLKEVKTENGIKYKECPNCGEVFEILQSH